MLYGRSLDEKPVFRVTNNLILSTWQNFEPFLEKVWYGQSPGLVVMGGDSFM